MDQMFYICITQHRHDFFSWTKMPSILHWKKKTEYVFPLSSSFMLSLKLSLFKPTKKFFHITNITYLASNLTKKKSKTNGCRPSFSGYIKGKHRRGQCFSSPGGDSIFHWHVTGNVMIANSLSVQHDIKKTNQKMRILLKKWMLNRIDNYLIVPFS